MDKIQSKREEIQQWLKLNGKSYKWLAEACNVPYNKVRSWMTKTEIPREELIIINSMMQDIPKQVPIKPQLEEPRCLIVVKLKAASFERYCRIAEAKQMALNEYVMFCLERCDEQACD